MVTAASESFRSAQFPVQNASVDDIKPSFLKTYNVSERDNKSYVTGCDLLPNGDFVIADQEVPYVKYYDNQGVLKKQINTESCRPYDVCFIDNNTIAVSIAWYLANHEHILFVNIANNKVINKVHVGEGQKRIHFDQVLVVNNNSQKWSGIVLISIEGKVINRFKTKEGGGVFIANERIFCTERDNVAVACYFQSGNIAWRYQEPSIKSAIGIIVNDRGFIFVTCPDRKSVEAISPDRQSSRTILSPEQGLDKPYSLAIDRDNRKLMVSNLRDERVFLYQI